MSNKINTGLIGYGMGGQVFHAPMINSTAGLNLYAIRETKEENIALAKSRYPTVKIVKETSELLKDKNIELIVVATPNTAHYPLAKQALEAGKHVVVEKPFTVTSEEAQELIKISKKRNLTLSVYQNRRFDSDFRTVQKIIASELLGDLVEYEVHFDRFRNYIREGVWKEEVIDGGGILYDLGSHLIDQAQVLFGLPEQVYADIRTQRKGGKIPDNFELIMSYPGLKVTLKAGMLVKQQGPRITLLGTNGSFLKYGLDVQEENLKAGIFPESKSDWGAEPENMYGTIDTLVQGLQIKGTVESERGDYRAYYANLEKAILGKEALIVTPEQGKNTIKIIELAYLSNKEKKAFKYM